MKRALAIAIIAATAAAAHANGRPPEPTAIHFAPNNDTDIYLQVTFGMLESHDSGATWRWVCEEAIGYSGNYDPDYAVSSSGALYATTFDGLKILRDGCQFESTSFGATMFTQVANDSTGGKIYACASDPTAGDHKCYVSTNDGTSWSPIATGLGGAEVWWSSMEIAPSNPQIIYLTGYTFPTTGTRTDTIYKTVNGGTTWTPLSTAAFTTTNNSELLVSVSPDDPNFLILKVKNPHAGLSNAIWRSINGGTSWTQVETFDDYVDGVVIRKYAGAANQAATKAQVVLGTRTSGMWVSNDGGQTFTELTQPPSAGGTAIETMCMAEHNGELWACANNLPPDSMALGKSATADNWTKMLQFKDIAGTITCVAGTIEQDTCNLTRWCGLRSQLGITADPTNCNGSVDGVPPDGNGTMTKPKGCCDAGGSPAGALFITALVAVPLLRRKQRAL